jgi:hypothetical protein
MRVGLFDPAAECPVAVENGASLAALRKNLRFTPVREIKHPAPSGVVEDE